MQPLSLAGFWKLLSQVEERGGWWVAEIGGRRAHTAKTEREKVPHPRFKQSCPNLAWVCLQVELSVGFASVTPVQLSRKDPPETVGMLSKEGGFTGLNSAHFEMLVATWGPFLPAHSLGTKIFWSFGSFAGALGKSFLLDSWFICRCTCSVVRHSYKQATAGGQRLKVSFLLKTQN